MLENKISLYILCCLPQGRGGVKIQDRVYLGGFKIQTQGRVFVVVIPASMRNFLVDLQILERRPLGGGCRGVS